MANDVPHNAFRTIGEYFYETRVLKGREWTIAKFAAEALEGAVDAVMLGYIEKGRRFPSEALVRRLAALRAESPREMLAVLARDRIAKAFTKEISKVLSAPEPIDGVTDAELAVRLSQAVAALPDDGGWVDHAEWREEYSAPPKRQKTGVALDPDRADEVEALLKREGLVEIEDDRVRRAGRHYAPEDTDARQALAIEYALLFTKGLLDRLARPDDETGSVLRNHYLNIDRSKLAAFHEELDEALRGLAEKYATDPSDTTDFLNVLIAATLK